VGGDWVDVEWHAGIGCVYHKRCRKIDVIPIADVLAQAVEDGGRQGVQAGLCAPKCVCPSLWEECRDRFMKHGTEWTNSTET